MLKKTGDQLAIKTVQVAPVFVTVKFTFSSKDSNANVDILAAIKPHSKPQLAFALIKKIEASKCQHSLTTARNMKDVMRN